MIFLIDTSKTLPARIPIGVERVFVDVDGQIDPIASRSDLEFTIVFDIAPIVAEEKFNDVTVPQLQAVLRIVGGQPEIQFGVRANKQKVQIGVGP